MGMPVSILNPATVRKVGMTRGIKTACLVVAFKAWALIDSELDGATKFLFIPGELLAAGIY